MVQQMHIQVRELQNHVCYDKEKARVLLFYKHWTLSELTLNSTQKSLLSTPSHQSDLILIKTCGGREESSPEGAHFVRR